MAALCGFSVLIAPNWFRYFHFAHHRFTHEPGKDPELEAGKAGYLLRLIFSTSLAVRYGLETCSVLVSNALGLAG